MEQEIKRKDETMKTISGKEMRSLLQKEERQRKRLGGEGGRVKDKRVRART